MKITVFVSATLLATCLIACGGGASSTGSTATSAPDDGKTDQERKREAALEALRTRQEAACEQVAVVITDCAIEDARANMPPEEFAKLEVDKLAPAHRAKFKDQCMEAEMSVRQVQVFEGCVGHDLDCAAFLDCLDQAQPTKK